MVNQETLYKLSQILTKNNIIWGVGGSYLLQLYNLYTNPNDLDLWVQPSDMPAIKNIFKDFDEIKTDIYLPEKYHFKMKYYDTEVDFVAAFIIKPNRKRFEYNISPDNITRFKLNDVIEVPCTLLEDWYIIYRLLKRNEKAECIKNFFLQNNIDSNKIQLHQNSRDSNIPDQLKKDIRRLLNDYYSGLQLTIWDYQRSASDDTK